MRHGISGSVATLVASLTLAACANGLHMRPSEASVSEGRVDAMSRPAYVTGGVGVDARKELREVASNYNLKLVFSEQPRKSYVATVDVTIKDRKGNTVLSTPANGPWFLVRMPPGQYRVIASSYERKLEKKVQVGRDTATVIFVWPSSEVRQVTDHDRAKKVRTGLTHAISGL